MAAITNMFLEVNFGSGYSGLATVGYRLYQDDDTDSVARTTTGVFEIGTNTGNYGVVVPSIPDNAVGIEWDTGGGSPVYATEDLVPTKQRQFTFDVSGGRWLIDESVSQLVLYRADGTTEVARFDLKDINGNPSYTDVYERDRA